MNRKFLFAWIIPCIALVFATVPLQLNAEDPGAILENHEITDTNTGNTALAVSSSADAATSTAQMEQLVSALETLISEYEKLITKLEDQLKKAESVSTAPGYNGDIDVNTKLNVRASPWGKIIGKLSHGDKVLIAAKEGDWFKIRFGDGYAYVHSYYVIAENAAYESAKEVVRPDQISSTTPSTTTPSTSTTPSTTPTVSEPPAGQARYGDYIIINSKISVVDFAKATANKVSQNAGKYSDLCLSFAYYHAYKLFQGASLSSLSARNASKYQYASSFKQIEDDNMSVIVGHIYDYINVNKPVVLQVNGNKAGTSRHYVTVVGYRSGISRDDLTGKDLLIIDSYDGKLETMDTSSSRFMMTGHARGSDYGYQIYVMK